MKPNLSTLSETVGRRLVDNIADKLNGSHCPGHSPNIFNDASVSSHFHGVMKVEVCYSNSVTQNTLGSPEMSPVCCSEYRFVFFASEQVDSMHGSILLYELHQVAIESRLRRLGACYLNSLSECLQPLLLPEYCMTWHEIGRATSGYYGHR